MSETFRQKKLRACIHCRRVQYEKDFTTSGCANCGTRHCTPNFHGLIALMTPRNSWVARWQQSTQLKPGMYAVSVIVPQDIGADEDDLLEGEVAEPLHGNDDDGARGGQMRAAATYSDDD